MHTFRIVLAREWTETSQSILNVSVLPVLPDARYAEFGKKQIAVKEPPNESMDGMRDVTVVDPYGNQLRFITLLDKGCAEPELAPDRGGK